MINTYLIYTYAIFSASYLLHLVHYTLSASVGVLVPGNVFHVHVAREQREATLFYYNRLNVRAHVN